MASSNEIEKFLYDRLEVISAERSTIRESFNALDVKIKALKKSIGASPRETLDSITAEITAFEKNYSRSSRTKAEDRTFMYELDKLKTKKKNVVAYLKTNAELENLKTQMNILRNELLEKEAAIDELKVGLKKVKLASKSNVSNHEIIEKVYKVADIYLSIYPNDEVTNEKVEVCIAKIIGKNGSSLKHIEESYNVVVSIQQHNISLLGTMDNILIAFEYIYVLCDTQTVELSVREEFIIYLTSNKYNLVNDFIARYAIKMDIYAAKNAIKLIGLNNNVLAAKEEVLRHVAEVQRSDIVLEDSYLAFLIGENCT
jgi:rRNA processing protein Krr1/Pno1